MSELEFEDDVFSEDDVQRELANAAKIVFCNLFLFSVYSIIYFLSNIFLISYFLFIIYCHLYFLLSLDLLLSIHFFIHSLKKIFVTSSSPEVSKQSFFPS